MTDTLTLGDVIDVTPAPTIHADEFGEFTQAEPITRHLLGADTWESMRRPVLGLLFGEMLRIADPAGMASFPSDLYHDALFLHEHVLEPEANLWWMPTNCNTSIGIVGGPTNGWPFDVLRRTERNRPWYLVDLIADWCQHSSEPRATWYARFTLCTPVAP